VFHDLEAMLAAVGKAQVIGPDVENAALEKPAGGKDPRHFFHGAALAERLRRAS
jgi:hypothetical protein